MLVEPEMQTRHQSCYFDKHMSMPKLSDFKVPDANPSLYQRLLPLLLIALLSSACSTPQPAVRPEVKPEHCLSCNVWDRAKFRGVAFRAIGQEPGWLLEITNGVEIYLVTDYGASEDRFAYVEPVEYKSERRTEFPIEEQDIVIEIRGEPCQDAMSGETFEVSVTIKQPDRELTGCGRALF